MPILTPQVIKRNQGMNQYPPPPNATASTSAAPAPQPPQFAPPPPQTNNYGTSGPPNTVASAAPPPPPPAPSPYQQTGIKGAPIPGQTVNRTSNVQGGPPQPNSAPQVGGGSISLGSEDQRLDYIAAHPGDFDTSISREQWRAWLPDLDQGCPQNKPFKTSRPGPGGPITGPERCVVKPDDCPDGMRVIGNDQSGSAKCLPQGDAAFSGGGGQGGNSGSGGRYGLSGGTGGMGGFGTPGAGGFGGVDDALQKIIMGQLQNPISRYTPEAIATLLSGTKATAEDQSQQARDAINEDAAARGVLGSGATGTALANARIGANRTVAGEQQNIARAKIDADYQDKVTAIQQAQTYLDQARDWLYKQQMRGDQKQQFEANIALAYARLQQDWDTLQSQQGYGLLQGAF